MSLNECRLIDLPKIADWRGNLTFIEGMRHVPFEVKRVYYLYDVPGGAARAFHPDGGITGWPTHSPVRRSQAHGRRRVSAGRSQNRIHGRRRNPS